jgi:hypothetical protein
MLRYLFLQNGQNDKNCIFIVWDISTFIFRLILLRFSFVFFINLPVRKPYRMVLSYRFWVLFVTYYLLPILYLYWLLDFPDLSVTFHLPLPLFVNMTELLTTVIQVGGLTRRKTWFNPPFSWKIPVLSRE